MIALAAYLALFLSQDAQVVAYSKEQVIIDGTHFACTIEGGSQSDYVMMWLGNNKSTGYLKLQGGGEKGGLIALDVRDPVLRGTAVAVSGGTDFTVYFGGTGGGKTYDGNLLLHILADPKDRRGVMTINIDGAQSTLFCGQFTVPAPKASQ